MKTQALLTALLMSSVVLAGCTGAGSDGGDPSECTEDCIDPTKGIISGLLVDDNFRPVQLKEDWGSETPGDFQDTGFILVLETGQRISTNENGEFEVTGLDPGTYSLQVAAEGHEAIEESVQVESSEISAVTLEARRKSSAGNPVLTVEFSGFVPCATGGVILFTVNCVGDVSGDSYRAGPRSDLRTTYGDSAHYAVVEAVTNQPGEYQLVMRETGAGDGGGLEWARNNNPDLSNPYMKIVVENSAVYGTLDEERPIGATHYNYYIPEKNPRFIGQNDGSMRCSDGERKIDEPDPANYCSWPNSYPREDLPEDEEEIWPTTEFLVFYVGDEPIVPETEVSNDIGAGYRAGIRINYVLSFFIGEPTSNDDTPEDDLNEYCVICKGYLDES